MKKIIILFLATATYLFPPALALSDTYYRILLKNGGRLTTPTYWQKDSQTYFIYANGIVGVEKNLIKSIEKYERETDGPSEPPSTNLGEREILPSPSAAEKTQEEGRVPEATKERKQELTIADYKKKKDKLKSDLDQLLERQREASSKGDDAAKAKIGEEVIKVSREIYSISDEAKETNKGKLPEGWWKE